MIQNFLQTLARTLDRPNFPWKNLVLAFSLGQFALENWLLWRQYKIYKRTEKPAAIKNEITQETYEKSQDYSRAKARFGLVSSVYAEVKAIFYLAYDIFPYAWSVSGVLMARYAPAKFSGEITRSLLFMFGMSLIDLVSGLPWAYYRNFVLEEKYGFNKMTIKLWLVDMFKGILLSVLIGAPLGAGFLYIVQQFGSSFFYYLWAFMVVVQLVAVTVYPILIVPIFNKLTPLKPGPLRESVEKLCGRLKFPLDELSVIDGSKRSAHSNAYFSGLPWKKRIVLFDTLLEQSTDKEVEAVLGHELGHWKMGHTIRLLLVRQFHMFYLLAMWSSFLDNKSLYHSFGFFQERPVIIGFMLFSMIYSPAEMVIEFAMNMLTRKMEYEADAFAVDLGYKNELAKALIKLQIKNLSSMDADRFYSAFHHSHPILTERLKAIKWVSDGSALNKEKSAQDATEKERNGSPFSKENLQATVASGREL